MTQKNEKIKIRILAPVALALVIITIITIFLIYKFQKEHILGASVTKGSHVNNLLNLILAEKTELLSSLNSAIRNDPIIQNAWQTKDRHKLLQLSLPKFQDILQKYRVTHFYFIQLDKKVFLRVHHPTRWGDTIDRLTLQQSVQTKNMGAGLELGPMGTFTLRVVYPWKINGKLIGYIELGQEIDHIISDLHQLMGVELILMVNKELLDKASWQQTMKSMGKTNRWNQFEDLAVIANTLKDMPKLEMAAYKNYHLQKNNTQQNNLKHISSETGEKFSVNFTTLVDAGQHTVGQTIVLVNITNELSALQKLAYKVILTPTLIALILFISFYRYINNIEKKLLVSRQRLLEESGFRETAMSQARDLAEEAAKMKSQFLANMSHELRTPMNGVMGMLQLLDQTTLSKQQKEYCRLASYSSELLITLVNEILDLSKIEAGKMELEHIVFDIRATLEDVAESLSEIAYQKSLEVTCLIRAETPTLIYGDPHRLRQVFNNLIGNAIKFTSEGEIIIRMGIKSTENHEPLLCIEVIDTGIGISEEKLSIIFDSFTQADGSTTRHFGGTGLGLAICKRIIKQMGGTIGVKSVLEQGSCFYFSIPFKHVDNNQQNILSFEDIKDLRILLVNSSNTITELLQIHDLHVEHLQNNEEVINKLLANQANGEKFSVVIFDQKSTAPILELAKKIKSINDISDTCLILLTSFGHRGDAGDAQKAGIDAFLTKPVRQSILHDCLAGAIGMKQQKNKTLLTKHVLEEHRRSTQAHILVAENDEANQRIVVTMLKKLGYQADVTSNGEQVLHALENKMYHLILMDCHMSGMGGYETSQHIRNSHETWRNIPIIAITANTLEEDKALCLQAGMNEHLSKPLNQNKLEKTLLRYLSDIGPTS